MSMLLTESVIPTGMDDEVSRAQKLANAKKRLKSFRANKSTDTSIPSSFSFPSSAPIPLVTEMSGNAPTTPTRSSRSVKDQDYDLPPIPLDFSQSVRSPTKLKKTRSKGSVSHRRQTSSVSFGNGAFDRGSVMGLFESDELEVKSLRAPVPRAPSDITRIPATPIMGQTPEDLPVEDQAQVKDRLTAFTFGSKPPAGARVRSPRNSRADQPLLPSQLLPSDGFPSPNASPNKRLSTPSSRPPSLLLTRPTPLATTSPYPSRQLEPPQTPPTPARSKRHSHTRSNSISLPNLKLASRPTSLGIPSSPSFPSLPSSPVGVHTGAVNNGARLKFEPSGRGAEAEMEKDEYRRKALEKLTGSSPVIPDSPSHEISLPELDDEETSSVASSARPFSGFGSFSFGRPVSSSSTPSAMSWTTNDDSPPLEQWSIGSDSKAEEHEDALGFGFTFSGTGSGSFSFGAVPPPALPSFDTGIGMGLPSTMPARPSLTRNLSVLAEVDESEDGEVDQATPNAFVTQILGNDSMPTSPREEDLNFIDSAPIDLVAPTSSRLRELHLVSSSSTPPTRPSANVPARMGSPSKGYGAIGRGRPGPAHVKTDSPYSVSSMISTPQSAGPPRRRAGPGSGSRGSSISYKRDGDSSSSRDWSMSGKSTFSPSTEVSELVSSPPTFSPHHSGWGSMSRSGHTRPCPRPKSLAGMGQDNHGAGRILGELEEVDEDALSSRNTSYRLSSIESARQVSDHARDSVGAYQWRDLHLELEMERDELQEDVDLWRKRCAGLEEKLELEKKENGILRERARKLGDRVSSMSSYPVTTRETSLVADLRTQLFGIKAELEKERSERLSAVERVAELESQVRAMKQSSLPQEFISNVIPPTPFSPDKAFAFPTHSGEVTDNPSFDPVKKMRSWGFPRGPVQSNGNKSNRESFFGLSQVLRRDLTQDSPEQGVDLPPISVAGAQRSVSEPIRHLSLDPDVKEDVDGMRSTSLTTSATNALSFFADYLPRYARSGSPSIDQVSVERLEKLKRLPTASHLGVLDFSKACKCCTGDVLEV